MTSARVTTTRVITLPQLALRCLRRPPSDMYFAHPVRGSIQGCPSGYGIYAVWCGKRHRLIGTYFVPHNDSSAYRLIRQLEDPVACLALATQETA